MSDLECNVFWKNQLVDRHLARRAFALFRILVEDLAAQSGIDVTGRHFVDKNSVRSKLQRHAFAEHAQSRFRRTVRGDVRMRKMRRPASDENDAALFLLRQE